LPLNGGLAPSIGGAPYRGSSQLSTANVGLFGLSYSGTYASDDFAVTTTSPIIHVEWWGSYLNPGTNPGGVQQFLISFETDVPATDTEPSHPGFNVIGQTVSKGALAPGSGTFTETAIPTAPGGPQLYRYNAELAIPMIQTPDTVFWLTITALVNPDTDGAMQWGWQSRDYGHTDTLASGVPVPGEHTVANGLGLTMWHFQDAAVTGAMTMFSIPSTYLALVTLDGYTPLNYVNSVDGPTGINAYRKDLAFRLYTLPEPSALALIAMGGVAMLLAARRRSRG
jgi:hypothetical protein